MLCVIFFVYHIHPYTDYVCICIISNLLFKTASGWVFSCFQQDISPLLITKVKVEIGQVTAVLCLEHKELPVLLGRLGMEIDTLGFNPFVAIFLAMMECESLKAYQRNEDALLIDIDCFDDIVIEWSCESTRQHCMRHAWTRQTRVITSDTYTSISL